MKVGYARISTSNQNIEIQYSHLEKAGCNKIYAEKISSAAKKRPELSKALDFVREGDVLVCTRLDRLARSMSDLVSISEILAKKNVQLVVLEQQLDTTTITGKLLFNMIAAIAEFERSLIAERTMEGRQAAQKKGVKFGRKPILDDVALSKLREDFCKELDKTALAQRYKISRSTLYRLCANKNNG
ncbi:recombinase family protein [Vibrio campbellii]|uniref:recombinase family protein n=1 Tax=Vibrio campbellii TaxID=680 RepID=UPI001F3697B8|nr:recombinase family protein [Vibrio campbellii]MCE7729352.1 recombinase family protein [Vibrio campbellii]